MTSPVEVALDVERARSRFAALARSIGGRPVVFADAPGGTQVPDSVVEAMVEYLRLRNANTGGAFDTSRETDAVVAAARAAAADFIGGDPDECAFGQNMTTLSFGLSRSVAGTLSQGDEVVVTRLDHDGNIAPWLAAASDSGAAMRWVDLVEPDGTLDLPGLEAALSSRTKVVAFTLASNALGTVTPAAAIVERVRAAAPNALVVADAVHAAQHRLTDVRALGADVLFCSPYKFFGPHLGIMWSRRAVLDHLPAYRVRPQPDRSPERWETGTLSHEALAGLVAAVDYLGGLAVPPERADEGRRAALVAGMDTVSRHERDLSLRFLAGIADLRRVQLWGIADPARVHERTPTFALRVEGMSPRETAAELGRRGIFVWDGNYFAQAVMERLGLEATGGAVRVGFCHYHTADEVDRVVGELASLARG